MPIVTGGAFVFTPTYASTVIDYNLRTAAISAGWNQTDVLRATITINSGVIFGASSTGSYAFDTGSSFPAGSSIALINNGLIIGCGGAGGGTQTTSSLPSNGYNGAAGGPALRAQVPISITNNNIIGGGGGGGGGGGSGYIEPSNLYTGGGGGGGGQGYYSGSGGTSGRSSNSNGGNGAYGAPGAGGDGGGYGAGGGGYGGSLGAAGGAGVNSQSLGGSGGAGGYCTTGIGNITWIATGYRYGTLG